MKPQPFSGAEMKFKELSLEFRRELFNAIRLSVFLTALVLGFLVFQNRTVNQAEVNRVAGNPEASSAGRTPASIANPSTANPSTPDAP
jgi:hypothetical protein